MIFTRRTEKFPQPGIKSKEKNPVLYSSNLQESLQEKEKQVVKKHQKDNFFK